MSQSKYNWPLLIQEFSESSLNQKEFCQKHELNAKYFSLRRTQLLDEKNSENRFLKAKVSIKKSPANLTLKLRHGELCFDSSVDPTYVASLLRELS